MGRNVEREMRCGKEEGLSRNPDVEERRIKLESGCGRKK